MIAACRRGVSVRLIIDKGIETEGAMDLIAALNGDNWMDRNGDGDTVDPVDQPQTGPCGEGEPVPDPEEARQASIDDPIVQGDGEPLASLSDEQAPPVSRRRSPPTHRGAATKATSPSARARAAADRAACTQVLRVLPDRHRRPRGHGELINLNAGGALKGCNDLYTMKRVPQTYTMYEQVHDEMGRDKDVVGGYRTVREGPFRQPRLPHGDRHEGERPGVGGP